MQTDNVWVILYQAADDKDSAKWLDIIKRQGGQTALERMLIDLPLTGREMVKDKPWGLFADHYTLGDYTLVWDLKKEMVWVYEETDLDDPYANV